MSSTAHVLASTDEVAEWSRATLLTDYQARTSAPLFKQFLDTYRALLLEALGQRARYFYAFKRILLWARVSPGAAAQKA